MISERREEGVIASGSTRSSSNDGYFAAMACSKAAGKSSVRSTTIPSDRQIDAHRLGNSEHQAITNLPVADRSAVFLAARIHPHRQPFAARGIFISQQCDKLSSSDLATKFQAFSSQSGPYAGLFHQVIADRQFAVEAPLHTFCAAINFDV